MGNLLEGKKGMRMCHFLSLASQTPHSSFRCGRGVGGWGVVLAYDRGGDARHLVDSDNNSVIHYYTCNSLLISFLLYLVFSKYCKTSINQIRKCGQGRCIFGYLGKERFGGP